MTRLWRGEQAEVQPRRTDRQVDIIFLMRSNNMEDKIDWREGRVDTADAPGAFPRRLYGAAALLARDAPRLYDWEPL
jgi:hypothetical protein